MKQYNETVYTWLRQFDLDKIYRVFGNHDIDWDLVEPISGNKRQVAYEAILLKKDGHDLPDIFLSHGHQAEEKYEKNLHTVRMATAFFRAVEKIFNISSSSLLNEVPGKKDRIYDAWASKQKKITICGHTHCPIFAGNFIDYSWICQEMNKLKNTESNSTSTIEKKRIKDRIKWLNRTKSGIDRRKRANINWNPPDHQRSGFSKYYYNCGGCLFSDGITNIEIDGDNIRLVYWLNSDQKKETLWEDKISSVLS